MFEFPMEFRPYESGPRVDKSPKGSRKNYFPCLGAETPVWYGARTAHTASYGKDEQRRQTGWIDAKHGKLFLREP